jgi:HPt (histidine-containing phosphotransfer) domain-containing protein
MNTSANNPDMNAINQGTVNDLLGLQDPEFILDLVTTFKEEAPKYLKAAQDANQRQEFQKLRIALHQLKGSCGTIGAQMTRNHVISMYDKIDNGYTEHITQDMKKLEKLLRDTYEALDIAYGIK